MFFNNSQSHRMFLNGDIGTFLEFEMDSDYSNYKLTQDNIHYRIIKE